jgi:outer membrane protein assembly factor BamB
MRMRVLASIAIAVGLLSAAAQAENWAQWRGPNFNGATAEKGLPQTFSKTENVAWVTPLPGPSSATPIIWGDKVFVSSTDSESGKLMALCLSATDGKVLWKKFLGKDGKMQGNNFAGPSPVTDGKRVVFLYASGDLAAFDFAGNQLWARNLIKEFGSFCLKYGYNSSPLLYQDRLYVVVLRSGRPYPGEAALTGQAGSYLLAIDPATGKDIWKQDRPTDAVGESCESYVTPIPYEGQGKPEILLAGGDYITSHDPATGKENWRYCYNPQHQWLWRLVPSPVTLDQTIFAITPRSKPMYAIRPGNGTGKLPETVRAWTFNGFREKTSDSATPLVYEGRLYVLDSDSKSMVCLDPKTGEQKWQGNMGVGTALRGSPTGADGRIWCLSEAGDVVILAAGDQFKILAKISLGETPSYSTIAVANQHVYVRTAKNLYCFGKPFAVGAAGATAPAR